MSSVANVRVVEAKSVSNPLAIENRGTLFFGVNDTFPIDETLGMRTKSRQKENQCGE